MYIRYIYSPFCYIPFYSCDPLLSSPEHNNIIIEGTMDRKRTSNGRKMKTMKSNRGFMCQSPGSTAIVCMTVDPRSIVVPRRSVGLGNSRYSSSAIDDQNARLISGNGGSSGISSSSSNNRSKQYSLLVDSRGCKGINMTTTLGCDNPQNVKRTVLSTSSASSNFTARTVQQKPEQVVPTNPSSFQVVVMRVSIHCQGCAGKVKKHLSKMEGVTSFSIDLETKRVTVMGHVSPVGVLESISKVKKAEFWSITPTTTTTTTSTNNS
ncbi:hypothetical protein C5167_028131 [Papaver somniferum]|uniref:protein SODIUM POTASSIUM ROOT DEFECTIVE 3-like n=1 Tax=Papaver somniferum TaxID=3469 RepID=UPI000E6FF38F|nr:protein SODIUM POTASSIUM ROOT DEFECTIVE 3-like [Papaver somniferum]RZC87678.1 hypothetical protein C5167_028131 [Papaver somniferum]